MVRAGNTRKIGILAVVAMMLISVAGAGIVAAAVSGLDIDADENNEVHVDEDATTDIVVAVHADGDGVTDETLTVDITDDGDILATETVEDINVDPDDTEMVPVEVDVSGDGYDIAPGEYSIDAEAGEEVDGANLVVNDVQEPEGPSVSFESGEYTVEPTNDSVTIDAILEAGDENQTSDAVLTVENADNETVHTVTLDNVSVDADEDHVAEFDVDSADVDGVDGDEFDVTVEWAEQTDTAALDVSETVTAGAILDDSSVMDPIVIGGVVVFIALIALAVRAD